MRAREIKHAAKLLGLPAGLQKTEGLAPERLRATLPPSALMLVGPVTALYGRYRRYWSFFCVANSLPRLVSGCRFARMPTHL